jgi:hypothetical protein
MTFKHVKFEDSATMRSLIKVAAEKGWVKNNPLEKYASVERDDLTPTDSLTLNVMKLCAGLRSQGMNKYADEVETNFVAYKKAAGIYDVSGEKGEDLVDAAHPDGGHKMEDMIGDSLVETILERHLKMVEMIGKKPTGKLASHLDILGAVKNVLGQGQEQAPAPTVEGLVKKIQDKAGNILKRYNSLGFFFHGASSDAPQILVDQASALNSSADDESLDAVISTTYSVRKSLKPGVLNMLGGGFSEEQWNAIESDLVSIESAARKIKAMQAAPAPAAKSPLEDLLNQANSLKNKVQSWKAVGSIIKHPGAKAWIETEANTLQDIIGRYSKVPNDQQAGLVGALTKELNAELVDINQFEKNWITG